MKLKIRYENEFQTIELDAKATDEMWVSLSLDCDDNMVLSISLDTFYSNKNYATRKI